jgi:serine/threonine protein kinase/Tol biopolymer transport system component
MPLTSGQRLGPYEVVGVLGAGGMGEVYRARDTKLNREVAIKVLSASFVHDTERLARFTREAQTLAALNHPNIAQVYGLEGQDGREGQDKRQLALVMELVEGEDLSQRLARGAIPLDEVLPIARQIADALEAAHEQGIVHRDLKPANLKVKSDGTVKVLDFGLAKAVGPASSSSAGDPANSPTLTAQATQLGMILGTAAYMAPEQAKGRPADRRADIWAFGVVLYEMLTGRRAFEGDDLSEVLASVLKSEPAWTAVPIDTPPSVRRLLRRCLEKDPRRRLSSIGDARLELDEHEPATSAIMATAIAPAVRPSLLSRLWPALATLVVTAGVAAFMWPRSVTGSGDLARLSILPPPGSPVYPDSAAVAISPDGTMVAFLVGTVPQSASQLWVRSIDSLEAHRIADGDDARLPFWSPDSRRIGFFTSDKLKTIAVSGGRAAVLCDAPGGRGAAWAPSNVIIFAPDAGGPLYRVAANGGTPVPITTLDPARKEYSHRFPTFLPDGDHFLYAALPGKNGRFDIFAGSFSGGSRTFVASMESAPVYADPGWLLYAQQGMLTAQPFDAKRLRLTGDPAPLDDEPASVLEPVWSYTAGRPTSISSSGSLAYFSAPSTKTTAIWLDATGKTTGTLNVPPGYYDTVSISPDGTHAVLVRSTSPSESNLWLVDLARGGASPLSTGRGRNDSPIWSPDGTRVVFAADRDGPMDFFIKNVVDASAEQPFYRSDVLFKSPTVWSSDGQWIVAELLDRGTAQDIWLLPTTGGKEPKPFVRGPASERGLATSPDGHWMAYDSNETGRFQLYVQAFPEPGHKIQVSEEGASRAWWTRDGRQIVFADDKLQSVWRADIESGATLRVGAPRQVATLPPNVTAVDAMPDGQRFLAIVPERAGPGSVTVVRNWRAALEKKR